MEGVPITDGRHLEELQESEKDDEGETADHENCTPLGRVHVRVDVKEEDDVYDGHILGTELYGAPRSDEDEHKELKEVGVAEVGVINVL